ncbi:MAG: hypothetical protein JNL64_04550 [Blastocatellia bacterium]|nr:hypothetical protein [Blastocatellia bacterium]
MKKISVAYFALLLLTLVAVAQQAPSGLGDLVGIRASNGESELSNRGFKYVKTSKGGGTSYTNWWRSSDQMCITVATVDGRYNSIVKVTNVDCNKPSGFTWNSGGNWGGNGGWNNNSDRQISPPDWARGNFYATGPRGEHIQLTINNNGSVIAYVNGGQSYGSFTGGNNLSINGARSSVSRNGNGITTTSTSNGERIVYSRNSWGNSGGSWHENTWGSGNNGGGQVNPPSWARGNFYGTGPGGERITLTINSNGSVSSDVDGGVNYGSYISGDMIRINSATSRVSRNGGGITTTSTINGERINYSRSGWSGEWRNNSWSNNNNWSNSNSGYASIQGLSGKSRFDGTLEMVRRGFKQVDVSNAGSTTYLIYWRSSSRQCVRVSLVANRFDTVDDIGSHSKCRF